MSEGNCASPDGRSVGFGCALANWMTELLIKRRRCSLQADRGKKIGWAPKYSAQHILDDADHEVDLILKNL